MRVEPSPLAVTLLPSLRSRRVACARCPLGSNENGSNGFFGVKRALSPVTCENKKGNRDQHLERLWVSGYLRKQKR